jgi:hypothetical protein
MYITFRDLAEAKLEVCQLKKDLGILKGESTQILANLDLHIFKAEQNLAEVRLFDAIAQNFTDREIEARNASLISIRATSQSHVPISGNNFSNIVTCRSPCNMTLVHGVMCVFSRAIVHAFAEGLYTGLREAGEHSHFKFCCVSEIFQPILQTFGLPQQDILFHLSFFHLQHISM